MLNFKRFIQCLLTGAICLLSGILAHGQSPLLSFKHLSSKEGLSQSPVFSLLQDKKGFVWIGNREGLIRFDGYEFKRYVNKNIRLQNAIHNDVRTIHEDTKGNLWLGTASGLYQFETSTQQFNPVAFKDYPLIYALTSAGNQLWTATSSGLRLVNSETKQPLPLKLDANGRRLLQNGRVLSLYRDNRRMIWAGTDHGVVCFNPVNFKIVSLPPALTANSFMADAKVFAIKQDVDGDMWFGTENTGMFWYNSHSGACIHYDHSQQNGPLSNFIRDIYVYDRQHIWIGTRNGLNIFNKVTGQFSGYTHDAANPNSLSHNTVWNFMRDNTGNLWLATYAGGINIYNPANANFENIGEKINNNIGLNEPLVNAILPLPQHNTLLIGTDGGGVNYVDRVHQTSKIYSVKDAAGQHFGDIVKSLAIDNKGNILAGTLDGLAFLDLSNHQVRYFNFYKDPSPLIRINALLNDSSGVWIGTERNGLKFLHADGSYDSFMQGGKNEISDNYINALCKDHALLWIGTRNGLNLYNTANRLFQKYYPNTGSISSHAVLSLCKDSHNRLWVGTGDGLFTFDSAVKSFTRIGERALNSQVIQAITNDRQGNIWVSTFNGIAKISLLSAGEKSFEIINYTDHDGLASNQFSLGAVAGNGDELLFGGVNGVTAFSPERLVKNRYQARVLITDYYINNQAVTPNTAQSPLKQPIESTSALTLKHDQNFISFKFAALSFLNPENNKYAYKLDGLTSHEGWHYCGTQRTANYTNLEPGDYVFSLKAANNDGLWSDQITSIKITVLPPFWKTWWAYLLYIAAISATVYFVMSFFYNRAKLKRDLYYEHIEHERQQELNRMKLDFFTNISHELRTPLTLITGPVENILKSTAPASPAYPELKLIKNNADRLLKLVTELLDFRKAETGYTNIFASCQDMVAFLREIYNSFEYTAITAEVTYEFVSSEAEIDVYFDANQLEKVIYNLLSNAFKVTPHGGKVMLNVARLQDTVEISVADSGPGIPAAAKARLFTNFYQVDERNARVNGTGIGLALSKKIVDLHGGTLDVTGAPADGLNTSFVVTLKLGSAHFAPGQLTAQAAPCSVDEHKITVPDAAMQEMLTGSDGAADTTPEHTVLVVEDNEELRTFLNHSLKSRYKVLESAHGLEGLKMATELLPDVIISDVMMPEMDGLELTAKLKTDDRTSHIPVVLLTARASHMHQVSGLETGADIYLTKPFSTQILELHINNLLNARRIWQQRYSQQVTLEPQHVPVNGPEQKFLNKLLGIIEDNIDNENFGVAMLASEIGMSQPVLYKKVKALTDLSVNDLVKSIRLKKAAQLLAQKGYTVYEVAYAVGFNDSKYFSKEFAKQFGVTPSAYKNAAPAN